MGDDYIKVISEGKIGSRPSWDESFMHEAISISSRYSCFNVRAGSVLTLDNRVVGTGYNGAPGPIKNSLDRGYCTKERVTGEKYGVRTGTGTCIGNHAERNALDNVTIGLTLGGERLMTLYNTIFPCHDCTIAVLGKVERVVFKKGYQGESMRRDLELFKEAGVRVDQLDLSLRRVLDISIGRPALKLDVWSKDEREQFERVLRGV